MQITTGVPLVIVFGQAVHSRTSTTTDIYSHFIQSSDNVAESTLDNQFQAEPKEAVNKELEEFKKIKQEMKQLRTAWSSESSNNQNQNYSNKKGELTLSFQFLFIYLYYFLFSISTNLCLKQ